MAFPSLRCSRLFAVGTSCRCWVRRLVLAVDLRVSLRSLMLQGRTRTRAKTHSATSADRLAKLVSEEFTRCLLSSSWSIHNSIHPTHTIHSQTHYYICHFHGHLHFKSERMSLKHQGTQLRMRLNHQGTQLSTQPTTHTMYHRSSPLYITDIQIYRSVIRQALTLTLTLDPNPNPDPDPEFL